MNYKLSIYASNSKKKAGYVLTANGYVLAEKVIKFKNDSRLKDIREYIRDNILHVLYMGLLECKIKVSHSDMLIIEIQDRYLSYWLNGMIEYNRYSENLDKVFGVLELLDCRYKFYYNAKPHAKGYLLDKGYTSIQTGSIDDLMKDFKED